MKYPAIALLACISLLATAASVPTGSLTQTHPTQACSFPTYVNHAGWDLCWQQDDVRGQGLELNQVMFQGQSVAWKIGFPLSLTHYDGDLIGPFKDVLGSSTLLGGDNQGYGRGSLQI